MTSSNATVTVEGVRFCGCGWLQLTGQFFSFTHIQTLINKNYLINKKIIIK